MSEKQVTFRWLPNARKLLGKRDSRLRETIHDEFERNPKNEGAIEFGGDGNRWVTPVVDNRYSVIWEFDPKAQVVNVQAVVPTRFAWEDREKDRERVRAQVSEVLALESES